MGRGSAVSPSNRVALSSVEKAKEVLARQVVSAFSELARSSSLSVTTGDISVRIPETDSILITPHAPFVEPIADRELLQITLSGRILHKRAHPSFRQQVHLEIYRQRPDVHAIVHNHAPMATLLGVCDLPIPPVTFDAVPFADLPRVAVAGVPLDRWPGNVAAALAKGAPAALLLNDGAIMVGGDLQQVVRRTLALEETARILVEARLLQVVPSSLPPEAVEALRQVVW
jgi:ribulose-5-phosphate 4-epimerase/fuculose-1-phosphate aldolase